GHVRCQGPSVLSKGRERCRFTRPRARSIATWRAEPGTVDAAAGDVGPRSEWPARSAWLAARATGHRSIGPAAAWARLWRRHDGQGARRDRRAARASHSRRIAAALRRELPSPARAGLYRAAAAGFLIHRR